MSTELSNSGANTSAERTVATDSIGNECAKRIATLLKIGEEKINFESNSDVVLILGNTGAGKTTFTRFIAGYDDRMISTEVGEYTGEFIVSDYDDKISANSTIISKTAFPELVVDNETKIIYVDNPGFNDSRNEAYDVAAAYFIKKVFDSVKNVKIILLTSYPSVRKGINRNDFLLLLEHVTALLKNIDRYTDSIALVATKVDNAYALRDGIPILIPDGTVISNIAGFLAEVKNSLSTMLNDAETYISESKRVESKTFCESAIKLLDALLTKKESEYARLGLFRRPDRSGELPKLGLLRHGKKMLKNMIIHNLRYLPAIHTEIGYALSDKSKNAIRDLIVEISENIVTDMTFINTALVTYYHNLEREMLSDDMYALRDRLASASKALSSITNIDESVSATDLVDVMCENFTDIGVHVRKSNLRNIASLGKFRVFLQNISAKEYKLCVKIWTKELDEAVRYVENSLKWYNFLGILHHRLSEYEVQKNKSSYQVPTFPALPAEGIYVKDLDDLLDFLNAISDESVYETAHYQEVKGIRVDEAKIRFFDQLIQVTLGETLVCTSFDEGQRVRVTGEYVLISEVLANKLCNSCDSLQIFATHTVFLDEDLGKDNDISIIAPRWATIGQSTIGLDGSAAQSLSCKEATDGLKPGDDGEDGIPGLPGTSAGHFLGIGSTFRNVENLSITASGGPGGPGQNGGDGATGETGVILDIQPQRCNSCVVHNSTLEKTIFTFPGGCGGNAGYGGAGGIGGHKGKLITVDTSSGDAFANSLKISNEGNHGKSGIPGKPGKGGKGGTEIKEQNYDCRCNPNQPNRLTLYSSARSKNLGNSGAAGQGWKYDQKSPKIKEFRRAPSLIVSDYLNELLKGFDNCIKRHNSMRFYEEIKLNDQLQEFFDVDALSIEMQSLEIYHNRFALDTTIILYHFILEKIIQAFHSSPEDHTKLECLHLAITSKLLRLQAKPEMYEILKFETLPPTEIVFGDRDISLISCVLDLLVENNLNPVIEHIDAQIIELSHPHSVQSSDDIRDLGVLLLKRKLFGDLETLSQSLDLLSILAKIDYQIVNEMSILNILPSLEFQSLGESAIKRKFDNAIYTFQMNTVHAVEALTSIILTERKSYQRSVQPNTCIIDCLRAIEKKLQSTTHSCAKSFSTDEAVTKLKKSLEKLRSLITIISDENTANNTNPDEAEIMKRIEIRKKLIEFDAQIYNKVNRDSNIARIVEALDSVENVAKKFEGIVSLISPLMKTIHMNVAVEYDTDKILKMTKTLFDFINTMIACLHNVGKQFDTDVELLSVIENLVETMKVLRSIYGTIASTELRSRLWKYSQWITKKKGFEKLDEFISRDFLLYEHRHFVNVYNRLVFPFNVLNPGKFTAPSVPENVDESIADLRKSLEGTRETLKITLDTLSKNPPTEYTTEEHFNATSNQGPLYEWKYALYAKTITDLLRGKQIALTATVDPKDPRQFLRFSSIRLCFQTLNENTQVLLNHVLRNFDIRMIHSGSSSFAFCNQTHSINEEYSEYKHTADTDAKTEQLKSPYTMWLFSLHPTQENVTFHSLHPFVDQPVNLLLEGHVKYLKIEDEAAVREKFEIANMNADYSLLIQSASQTQ